MTEIVDYDDDSDWSYHCINSEIQSNHIISKIKPERK
jgi:hypothetical protein